MTSLNSLSTLLLLLAFASTSLAENTGDLPVPNSSIWIVNTPTVIDTAVTVDATDIQVRDSLTISAVVTFVNEGAVFDLQTSTVNLLEGAILTGPGWRMTSSVTSCTFNSDGAVLSFGVVDDESFNGLLCNNVNIDNTVFRFSRAGIDPEEFRGVYNGFIITYGVGPAGPAVTVTNSQFLSYEIDGSSLDCQDLDGSGEDLMTDDDSPICTSAKEYNSLVQHTAVSLNIFNRQGATLDNLVLMGDGLDLDSVPGVVNATNIVTTYIEAEGTWPAGNYYFKDAFVWESLRIDNSASAGAMLMEDSTFDVDSCYSQLFASEASGVDLSFVNTIFHERVESEFSGNSDWLTCSNCEFKKGGCDDLIDPNNPLIWWVGGAIIVVVILVVLIVMVNNNIKTAQLGNNPYAKPAGSTASAPDGSKVNAYGSVIPAPSDSGSKRARPPSGAGGSKGSKRGSTGSKRRSGGSKRRSGANTNKRSSMGSNRSTGSNRSKGSNRGSKRGGSNGSKRASAATAASAVSL